MSESEHSPGSELGAEQREDRRHLESMANDMQDRFGPRPTSSSEYHLSEACSRRGNDDE